MTITNAAGKPVTTIVLSSLPASRDGGVQIAITAKAPFPKREVDVANLGEAQVALEKYLADAKETGISMVVMIDLKQGQRVPRGFKAFITLPPYYEVNL